MESWFTSKVRLPRNVREYDIRDFGARSDSSKIQTEAIQRAIDAAAVRGGMVVIPEGVYCSGALFFKHGTSLRVDGTLKGSDDIADYPYSTVHIEGVQQDYISALVNAYGVNGFCISGTGTIDGNGLKFWEAFWARRKENPKCTNLEVLRPRLIHVAQSTDVLIKGVKLSNPGFWTTHLYKCKRVRLFNLDIKAPTKGVKAPSSDAVDIDGCSMVHIRGCKISVNDDFIALKGGKGPWADQSADNAPDEKVLIEDCNFGAGPHVLTFGSECYQASNVILRNSKVRDTEITLRLKIRPDTPQNYSHILLENISGYTKKLVHIRPWTQFYDPGDRKDVPMSYVSDVKIRNSKINCGRILDIDCDTLIARIQPPEILHSRIFEINYDEKKLGDYTPKDPLSFEDGTRVLTADDWARRRHEILEIFQNQMYGRMPESCPIYLQTLEEGPTLGGKAMRRQIRMWFRNDHTGPKIDWLIVTPTASKSPTPAIITLNYYGNHTMLPDPQVLVPECWLDNSDKYGVVANRATEQSRGFFSRADDRYAYPLDLFLSRGWAFVTACYGDVSADPEDSSLQDELAYRGCFELWGPRDTSRTDNTTALGAWAWALSRGLDMIEQDKLLDASKVMVTGCSRLGKAALVAGAFDERFGIVVPNQTGGGGVPLARRNWGENVTSEVTTYTHWFCKAYRQYAGQESQMPFDQHMFLACIAPRALLVEGFDNRWFDAKGEFLAVKAASPVWEFLGCEGLPSQDFPKDDATSAIGHRLGYVHREGQHGLSMQDWLWMLDFADRQ